MCLHWNIDRCFVTNLTHHRPPIFCLFANNYEYEKSQRFFVSCQRVQQTTIQINEYLLFLYSIASCCQFHYCILSHCIYLSTVTDIVVLPASLLVSIPEQIENGNWSLSEKSRKAVENQKVQTQNLVMSSCERHGPTPR